MLPSSKDVCHCEGLLKRSVITIRHLRHTLQQRKQINLSLCSFTVIVSSLVAVCCQFGSVKSNALLLLLHRYCHLTLK